MAGLLARGSMHFAAFPVSQWRCRKALSAYSRGGGCGVRSPIWIDPSTFPFDPLTLRAVRGTVRLCLCAFVAGRVKVETDVYRGRGGFC